MKNILIHLDDEDYELVREKKGDLSWRDYILKEVKGVKKNGKGIHTKGKD
jgi:predicted CopG family antitoxin